jgi:hypothetical protein
MVRHVGSPLGPLKLQSLDSQGAQVLMQIIAGTRVGLQQQQQLGP